MRKAPEAFRTISEVAELLETPAHVLRFWESKFYQIRPVKRAGGRRYYRPDDVALINGIRQLLQVQGLTIRGAQRILQEKGVRHVISMGAELPDLTDQEPPNDAPGTAAPGAGGDTAADTDASLPESAPAPAAPDGASPPAPAAPSEPIRTASRPRPAPETPPEQEPEAALPDGPRLPQILRQLPRDALQPQRVRAVVLARRLDLLLDRMSEASGAGRW